MKKIIAAMIMMVILTLSLGMAQAEGISVKEIAMNNVLGNETKSEVQALQEKADEVFGGKSMTIEAKTIELKWVTIGEVRYQEADETDSRSWIAKTWDWVTFWD